MTHHPQTTDPTPPAPAAGCGTHPSRCSLQSAGQGATLGRARDRSGSPVLRHAGHVGARLLIGQAIAKGAGVAARLTCIQENIRLATETLRLALPASEEPICSHNATQLGRRLNMSTRVMNEHMEAWGLQHHHNACAEWDLQPYCTLRANPSWGDGHPLHQSPG